MDTSTNPESALFAPVQRFERDEFLRRAEVVGQIGEEDNAYAETHTQASDRLVQAIRDAQFPDLWKPKRYGGLGVDLKSYFDIVRTTSRHAMAAGWLTYFYSIHEVWVGYMEPAGREEIFNDGGLVADVLAPVGKVEKDGKGYRLSGQWNFASGVPHSGWIGLGAVTQLPDGKEPEYCLFAVRVSECDIIRNWDTMGMRGTGSHGVSLNRVYVPPHRVLPAGRVLGSGKPMGGDYDHNEPIYRLPFLPFFAGAFPAVVLGGADRIVQEFQKRTEQRTRVYLGGASAKAAGGSVRLMAELKLRLFEIEGLIDRYRQQLETWLAKGQTVNTHEEKAMMFALRAQIAQGGVEIAVRATQALGGTALYRGDPVEQFTRDLIVLGSHASHLYEDAVATYGGAIFGGPAHPVW